MNKAIRILRNEHRSIAAVLHGLQSLAHKAADPSLQPEFAVFHVMIHYIDAFPERMHHPKEDRYLFARLAERALTDEDWREIGEAFSVNDDPIADLREKDLASLFSRIVSLAPEPIGLGDRWKRTAA